MIINNILLKLNKHNTLITTGLAITGVLVTAVESSKAGIKANYIIQGEEQNKQGLLNKKEVIKACWKTYIPTAVYGALTISSIILLNKLHLKKQAAIAALLGVSKEAFKMYKDEVVEMIGEKKAEEIKDKIAKKKVNKNIPEVDAIINTSKGDHLVYDVMSGRYFRSSMDSLEKAINAINREVLNQDFVSLNELYYELGLKSVKLGDVLGWFIKNGSIEADYSTQLTELDAPCIVFDIKDIQYYDIDY